MAGEERVNCVYKLVKVPVGVPKVRVGRYLFSKSIQYVYVICLYLAFLSILEIDTQGPIVTSPLKVEIRLKRVETRKVLGELRSSIVNHGHMN